MTSRNAQMIEKPSYQPRSFLLFCPRVALYIFVGWTGGIITALKNSSMVCRLAKPASTPSNFNFSIAWSALYFLMAVALWRL